MWWLFPGLPYEVTMHDQREKLLHSLQLDA